MRSQDTLGKIEKDKRLILMGRKKNNDPHTLAEAWRHDGGARPKGERLTAEQHEL